MLTVTVEWPVCQNRNRNEHLVKDKMSTQQKLKELIDYDPDTGVFRWKVSRGRSKRGTVAGSQTSRGYLSIRIDSKHYLNHRLAWLYMTGGWPSALMDHVNCDQLDNRFCNLREATPSQNTWNSRKKQNCKNNLKGARWDERYSSWYASIGVSGKKKYLGKFNSEQEAHQAYVKAAKELHGEYARAA